MSALTMSDVCTLSVQPLVLSCHEWCWLSLKCKGGVIFEFTNILFFFEEELVMNSKMIK